MNTTTLGSECLARSFRIGDGLEVIHVEPHVMRSTVPLVFVHGMWCNGTMFLDMMMDFAELGYSCYALSLRGHGASAPCADIGKVTIADYVADVEMLIDYVGKPVVLIGHSMGGIIGAEAALSRANRVTHYIGISCAPPLGVLMGTGALMRLPKYLGGIFGSKPVILNATDAQALLFNTNSFDELPELVSQMCPDSGTAAREITLMKHSLGRMPMPALVIGGEFDRITPHQRGIAKRLDADFAEVPCGHMVMFDPQRHTVIAAIHGWLRNVQYSTKMAA